ncbi:MAG: hypothetical protein ACXAC7_06650 [Candidatus Hodarchaeales archaeon]|jgi:hypothetical protein
MAHNESDKKITVLLIWNGSEFEPTEMKRGVDDIRDTLLYLSEEESTMIFRPGDDHTLTTINKRIIRMRVQSIAKSGFTYKNLRLGHGFKLIEHEGVFDVYKILKDQIPALKEAPVVAKTTPVPVVQPPTPKPVAEPVITIDPIQEDALRIGKLVLRQVGYGHTLIIKPGPNEPEIKVYKEEVL